MWAVDSADLASAKDAKRAISNVCIADTTRFHICGNAADSGEIQFAPGDPIHKLVDYNGAMATISNWFERGRTITSISLYHAI